MNWCAWIPGQGETEADARHVHGCDHHVSAEWAAQQFAEHQCGFSGDPFDQIEIRAKCGDHIFDVLVNVIVEPRFSAENARRVG